MISRHHTHQNDRQTDRHTYSQSIQKLQQQKRKNYCCHKVHCMYFHFAVVVVGVFFFALFLFYYYFCSFFFYLVSVLGSSVQLCPTFSLVGSNKFTTTHKYTQQHLYLRV